MLGSLAALQCNFHINCQFSSGCANFLSQRNNVLEFYILDSLYEYVHVNVQPCMVNFSFLIIYYILKICTL